MPVCERYEVPLPMKMAQYNMPLHVQTPPEDEYIMEDHYHDNGLTSPHEMGSWIDDQSDGGGKFRLKRRRRCGQCGPCQVKENCGKCQYCVRKDILKQACIYRKCVYLRKPVPRFRPEGAGSSSSNSSGGSTGGGVAAGGVGAANAGTGSSNSNNASNSKGSPQKHSTTPTTLPNHNNTSNHPNPSSFNSSAMAAAAAAVQSAELSSCQLAQNPFGLPVNNGVMDPLRTSSLDQHRGPLFDASSVLDPTRTSYLSGPRSLESGRSPALDLGRNTNTADSGFGTNSSMTTSPASSVSKPVDRPLPQREQFRSPMEQWGPVPYGFPHANPWTHPALQHNPAAPYGFQSGANHYTNPFGSSCRLGVADPTSHLAGPSQPSFHHNMPFVRPDFSAHTNFSASAPSMQPTMTAPFYPPPPHIPSSLPNFPSFNQLPSSAGPHGTYPMAHPPMYPGNFYPSFRAPNEPQIYHAQLPSPTSPFSRPHRGFPFFLGKPFKKGEGDGKEDVDELKKKFSIFRIPNCSPMNGDDSAQGDQAQAATNMLMQKDVINPSWPKDSDTGSMLLKTIAAGSIDEDLQQHMKRISGWGECDVISIDDFKMQAFIRSDGFNNLEIEIDGPYVEMEAALSKTCALQNHSEACDASPKTCRPEDQEDVSISLCETSAGDTDSNSDMNSALITSQKVGHLDTQSETLECRGVSVCSSGVSEPESLSPSHAGKGNDHCAKISLNQTRTQTSEESPVIDQRQEITVSSEDDHHDISRTFSEDVVVHLMQEGEEGLVTELEVPGFHVQLEEVCLDDSIILSSSNPQDLLHFISQHHTTVRRSSSPDLIFDFGRDHADNSDVDFDRDLS